MINRLVILLGMLAAYEDPCAQSIETFVSQQTSQVRSIDIWDTSYEDLESFGEAVGNAQVVLLGEQDHGDAPTFLAKARLIRYLHEKKGYSVLAFESDFFGLVDGELHSPKGRGEVENLMRNNTFSLWSKSKECEDLYAYVDSSYRTNHPLKITGFDSQLHGAYRKNHYRKRMMEMIDGNWHPVLSHVFEQVQLYYPLNRSALPTDSIRSYARIVDSFYSSLVDLPDSSTLRIYIESLKGYLLQQQYFREKSYAYNTVRDRQMANNVLWLLHHRFKGEKIIIWAHNYHIMRNSYTAIDPGYGRHQSMGQFLAETLKDSMYVLGFTSATGRSGRLGDKSFKVARVKDNSMEYWMGKSGYDYGFVNFKGSVNADLTGFLMKGKSHEYAVGQWTSVFDGVFYIRKMFPASSR